jgi:HSP20 family molecular chaperone IbpA
MHRDRDKGKATFSEGLLEIALPKREEAKPRQIQIASAPESGAVDVQSR